MPWGASGGHRLEVVRGAKVILSKTRRGIGAHFPLSRSHYFLPLMACALVFIASRYFSVGEADGISVIPIIVLALGVLLAGKESTGQADALDGGILFVCSLALLLPGYNPVWALVALLSLYVMCRERRTSRAFLLILAPALYQLSTTYVLAWFATPILSLDAILVASLLQITHGVGHAVDNLIQGPGGHQVLVLRGCSSWNNLGLAWLLLFAVTRLRNFQFTSYLYGLFGGLALALLLLNGFRLHSMSVDIAWHGWWHEAAGESVYETMVFVLIGIAVGLSGRHEKSRRQ